jgi:UDP-N-acetylglucosamine--N-acetylmuramyl-(pentapeptide) pyrophosphoryl-undecaprenol N-acetylglucosamine transferase
MRYLFAGGGTAGHIYPALTIADELTRLDSQAELLYVGTATGREAQVVPLTPIPFVTIASAGLINLSLPQKIIGGLKALKGVLDSIGHMRRFRPHVVIGTGGFVSGPVMLAARLMGIPVLIQEQNAFPGVTNRIASRWARAVFVPYEEARLHFPKGTRLVQIGNPVRPEVARAERGQGRDAFGFTAADQVLLIMGGSGGARDFNRAVTQAVLALKAEHVHLKVLHITGERYYEETKERYDHTVGVIVVAYLHNMPQAYAAADVGLFRAGALTLAEIAVRGLPAVLIPSPNVTHDHQEWNARTLERRGAAYVVREGSLRESVAPLAAALRSLLLEADQADTMRQALLALAQPEAGREIAQWIMKAARGEPIW